MHSKMTWSLIRPTDFGQLIMLHMHKYTGMIKPENYQGVCAITISNVWCPANLTGELCDPVTGEDGCVASLRDLKLC